MKLENQVCSLELAKRLKELGVKQESLFAWCRLPKGEEKYGLVYDWEIAHNKGIEYISAFTVAELGEMLPTNEWTMTIIAPVGHGWSVEYHDFKSPFGKVIDADTEANARAKLLVYLLENKLTTL